MYKRDGSLNCSPRSSGRKLILGHFSVATCILLFLTIHYTVNLTAVYIFKLVFLSCPHLQEALCITHYEVYIIHYAEYITHYEVYLQSIHLQTRLPPPARSNPHPCGHAYPRLFKLQFSCSMLVRKIYFTYYVLEVFKGAGSFHDIRQTMKDLSANNTSRYPKVVKIAPNQWCQ